MILQEICYNRKEICDSDNITAVITTEPTTKHINPLYKIDVDVSYYFLLLLFVLKVLYSLRCGNF